MPEEFKKIAETCDEYGFKYEYYEDDKSFWCFFTGMHYLRLSYIRVDNEYLVMRTYGIRLGEWTQEQVIREICYYGGLR